MKEQGDNMIVLDIKLNNLYAFKNFHMNLTYPKKIVGSYIKDEHLENHPNFRYKKVNIIMGANASGKTTLGQMLMTIFNFLDKKSIKFITNVISVPNNEASFILDMASSQDTFYRISCIIAPKSDRNYTSENIKLEVRKEKIRLNDSYESCVKRIDSTEYFPEENYLDELENMGSLDWFFEYPEDTSRTLKFPKFDRLFPNVLENILKALDPSIIKVSKSQDVEDAYVIRLQDKAVILQDGEPFSTNVLSSGTKAGVEIAQFVSAVIQGQHSFYYCDEKFSYIHSDIEKAILLLMIDSIKPDTQLFFTSHNTDLLDMNLPKHTFSFLRKKSNETERPITCIDASCFLKRNTDSLKNAVDNDLFSTAPSLNHIFAIAELQ